MDEKEKHGRFGLGKYSISWETRRRLRLDWLGSGISQSVWTGNTPSCWACTPIGGSR